jgi:hypothetical protein
MAAMPPRTRIVGCAVLASLALLSAAAVVGWTNRGETIFLRMAEAARATCF